MEKEIIDFQGTVYTRYPQAKSRSLSRYYYAYSEDRKRLKALHQAVWEAANGPVPVGYQVHHRDEDFDNNALDNLECLTIKEHRRRHRQATEKMRLHLDDVRPLTKAWHASPEGHEWHQRQAASLKRRETETCNCTRCGREFTRRKQGDVLPFCSPGCYGRWHWAARTFHETRKCAICGADFMTTKKDDYKTCSRKCGAALRIQQGTQGRCKKKPDA